MHFRGSPHPPPFLNRKDQFRLLALVGLLTFILIAIKIAAQPETWKWMFPDESATQSQKQSRGKDRTQVNHRVQLDDEPELKPGEFISRRPVKPVKASAALPPSGAAEESSRTETIRFAPGLFDEVRDNTLGVRHDEAAAYQAVLKRVRSIRLADLERAGERVGYTLLMLDADQYRGRPITLEGRLHRLLPLPARQDAPPSDQLYEAWLFTDESETDPYRVVCVEIDDGLAIGEEIRSRPRVRVTGYFFKRQGYASQGGLHVAPLLLARRLRRVAPTAISQPHLSLVPWIVGLALLIGGTLAIAQWRFTHGDRAFAEGCLKQVTTVSPDVIKALDDVETVDPNDIFHRLSREDSEIDET